MSWIEIFQNIAGVIVSVGGAGEAYKSQLDIIKENSLRYSGQQFELYNKLWHSLYDLKSIADDLWTEANEFNLWKFSHQLKKTIDEVEKSCLFIEENHHQELKKLLEQFSEYRFGKTKVIQFNKNRGK